jgi:hypothetical protein
MRPARAPEQDGAVIGRAPGEGENALLNRAYGIGGMCP